MSCPTSTSKVNRRSIMIPTLQPITFLLVFVLCCFIHNGSAFRFPDDTTMPGQPGFEIRMPEPEEPPPEDGRSVYDPDVLKQWQGLRFTDEIPQEPEMVMEDEGPMMPSYPWRGGGHDPLPLSDPSAEEENKQEEEMLVGYIDCKKVRTAEEEYFYHWEDEEEEGAEKSDDFVDSEESDVSTDTNEPEESGGSQEGESNEDQETETPNEGDDEEEECSDETCDDDVCEPDESASQDENVSMFGVRADDAPATVITKESVVSLPFVQNTELFGRNPRHRHQIMTNNNTEIRRRILLPCVSGVPKYESTSQAIVKQEIPLPHKNGSYSSTEGMHLNKKRFKSKNRMKSIHVSTLQFNRREHRRMKNKKMCNSESADISQCLPKLSKFLLQPDISSLKREIPYFSYGEMLQPLIERKSPRYFVKNNFLQEFRGVPKEEHSRFSLGETVEGEYQEDADTDDAQEGGGMKAAEGWIDHSTQQGDFGAPLTFDQCEQCLPCCAYFSHRESESGSFTWHVDDECKPDDRDLDVASAECRTCHVRRRPAGQGVTLTCYECAAQQPDQTCRLGPRNPEMSQYRVSSRFFIISQSNETSSTMTQAQSLMARRPKYFVPQDGTEGPGESDATYPFEEEEEGMEAHEMEGTEETETEV